MTKETLEQAKQIQAAIEECQQIIQSLLDNEDISVIINGESTEDCILNLEYLGSLYNCLDNDELNLTLVRFFESEIKRLKKVFAAL